MRNLYDLTHLAYRAGEIGRLQTVSIIPVIAGDSLEFDVQGIYRLANLRRELVQDAKIDICYFYQPYRHIYGDDWMENIQQGPEGPGNPLTTHTFSFSDVHEIYLKNDNSTEVPLWVPQMYNNIWNRYWKNPDDADRTSYADVSTTERLYGYLVGRLPNPKHTPRKGGAQNGSGVFDLDYDDDNYVVPVLSNEVNIRMRDMQEIKGQFRAEVMNNIFSNRYNEVIENKWGSKVNTDADPRPTLLWKHSFWTSGLEINATDTTSLGSFVGKVVGDASHSVPRKAFQEHGVVWITATVRFPTVMDTEQHDFLKPTKMNSQELIADPNIVKNSKPETYNASMFSSNASFTDTGYVRPFADQYRFHPNNVHKVYRDVAGYPFSSEAPSTVDATIYHVDNEYDDAFDTAELAQWTMNLKMGVKAYRNLADPRASWMVGTK